MIPANKELPQTVSEWKVLAKRWNASGAIKDLGSQEKIKSVSGFEFKHFLGLRVIYEKLKSKQNLPDGITKQFLPVANKGLDNLKDWHAYLDEIDKFAHRGGKLSDKDMQECVPSSLGALANVWHFQKHVLSGDEAAAETGKVDPYQTPTPAPRFRNLSLAPSCQPSSLFAKKQDDFGGETVKNQIDREGTLAEEGDEQSPEEAPDNDGDYDSDRFYTPARAQGRLIKDEQTVNVFLLTLLSAITATTVPHHTRWLAERNAMVFQKDVKYVARTDGLLRSISGDSLGLIEVKPRERSNDVSIRVQESAQIAAWIAHNHVESHDPERDCKMFLLSQDRDEIHVTFPYFSKRYGKYDKKIADLQSVDFLRMRE